MEAVEVITLTTIAGGAAVNLFQGELDRVLRNIQDPNTEARATRKITLEISFAPDEERELGEVQVRVSAKLAGMKGAKTRVFFGRHKGQFVATEFDPKQVDLFDDRPEIREVK